MHIHAYTCMHPYIHTSIHPYIHPYMHIYIHACMHAYIHTYIPAYICCRNFMAQSLNFDQLCSFLWKTRLDCTMEITKTSVLRSGTLLLVAAALLKLLSLLVSFLWSHKWSIPSAFGSCRESCRQILSWCNSWKRQQGHGDSSSEQELGVMRCKWMWRFAFMGCVLSMYRLIYRQAMRHDEDKAGAEFDLNVLVASTYSLFVVSFPGLLTPRSQDIAYVVGMFFLDASYLIPPVEVDVRSVIALSFPGRFIFGVLARRTSATAFCMLLHVIQTIQIIRFWLMVWNIFYFSHIFGMSSFQLTNSYFSEGSGSTTNQDYKEKIQLETTPSKRRSSSWSGCFWAS